MSHEWHLVIRLTGVDLDDEEVVEALAPRSGLVMLLSSAAAVTTVDATVEGASVDEALARLVDAVTTAVPGAKIVGLIDPLVAVVDIADEAGVTRQAVQNWVTGARKGGFPAPLAVVGDGIRVWRLADVDAWLTEVVNLGSGRSHPSALFVAEFNEGRWARPTPTPEADGVDEWHLASESTASFSATQVVERTPVGHRARKRTMA